MPSDELGINSNHRSPQNQASHFDQDDARYRTCCCHVRQCCLIIGILEMIALVASVVGTAVAYIALPRISTPDQPIPGLITHAELSLIGSVTAFFLGTVVIFLLVYGVVQDRPALLLPHIIAQLGAIIGLASAVIVFVYVTITESDYGPMIRLSAKNPHHHSDQMDTLEMIYGCIVIGLCALACALEIYFVIVVYRGYVYVCENREEEDKPSGIQLRTTSTTFPSHDAIAAQRFMVQDLTQ